MLGTEGLGATAGTCSAGTARAIVGARQRRRADFMLIEELLEERVEWVELLFRTATGWCIDPMRHASQVRRSSEENE